MTPLLDVAKLVAGYGSMNVLYGVTMHVDEAETVCVIGANGAGKTTLLNAIVGIIKPFAGQVLFDGQDVTNFAPMTKVRKGFSLVLQGRSVFPHMTVLENLEIAAYQNKDKKALKDALEMVYTTFPILSERKYQAAGTMSGGEQKMLEIGRAMIQHPRLLMLDEPSLGLAPKIMNLIFEKIQELNKLGMAVLLVEQNAYRALEICKRAYVIELGKLVASGPSQTLLNDGEIRKYYLG